MLGAGYHPQRIEEVVLGCFADRVGEMVRVGGFEAEEESYAVGFGSRWTF